MGRSDWELTKMPSVTILPSGKTIEAATGSRLLDAILAAGETIVSKCGGEAKCGQCHVYVQEGKKTLSRTTRAENEKLDTIVGVSSKSRLACQAMIGAENVTVELLGFDSGF
jgi:ferredoxin, 2Fe-2S